MEKNYFFSFFGYEMQFIYFLYKIFYDKINDIQFNATQKLSTMSIEKSRIDCTRDVFKFVYEGLYFAS